MPPRVLNKNTDKIPKDAVYVGRWSKYCNIFRMNPSQGHERVVLLFARLLQDYIDSGVIDVEDIKADLAGRDLVCYCAPLKCHADVLLLIANPELIIEEEIIERTS